MGLSTEIVSIPEEETYISGTRYTLGIDLDWGGAIHYVSDNTCKINGLENLINKHDAGRLIQQSYYGTTTIEGVYESGSFDSNDKWPYNPVQGGDKGGYSSRLIDFVVEDGRIYIKSQPQDWGKVNAITPSYMENVYEIEDDYIRVENRFVDFSGWSHPTRSQEVPAFYTVSYLDTFVWYNSSAPWTGDTLNYHSDLPFWGSSGEAAPNKQDCTILMKEANTETWCAWINNSQNYGLGLYVPNVDKYSAGRNKFDGSMDPDASSCSYVAPVNNMQMVSYVPFEYQYLLAAGSVEEIRAVFTEQKDFADNSSFDATKVSLRIPDYDGRMDDIDFSVEKNVPVWTEPHSVTISYDSTEKATKVVTTDSDPYATINFKISSDKYYAEDYAYIELDYMIPTTNANTSYTSQFFLCSGNQSTPAQSASVNKTLIKDGKYHTLYLRVENLDFWAGQIHRIRLDFFNSSQANDVIYIRSLRLTDGSGIANMSSMDFSKPLTSNLIHSYTTTTAEFDSSLLATKFTATDGKDPNFCIHYGISPNKLLAEDYNTLSFTYMIPSTNAQAEYFCEIFLCAGATVNPTAGMSKSFKLTADGQFHTVTLDLSALDYWTGNVNLIRVDYFSTASAGDVFYLKSFALTNVEKEEEITLTGEHADLIEHTNSLANGVQAYFTDGGRSQYSIQNQEMTMNYARSSSYPQYVESIKNTKGAAYIQNTMDVFLRMKNGDTFYASQSAKSAEVNLYRFGYYYFEGFFEFQNFIPTKFEVSNEQALSLNQYSTQRSNNITQGTSEDGQQQFMISNVNDPYMVFDGFSYDSTQYDTLIITAKALGNTSGMQIFLSLDGKSFNEAQSSSISVINDGEYHTYYIPLSTFANYTGSLTSLRLDPSGAAGGGLVIKTMTMAKSELGVIPEHVSINRHFHVYSDKMHHAVQFATTETTTDIAEMGMVTEISADTVAKILIKDKNGEHAGLDGIDWASVECVGFDIKEAGIFGFIMPNDKIAGNINVELVDGKYVIEQAIVPENGTINPSIGGKNDRGNYIHALGVVNNGNDIYLGQRIYTDESHDFTELLFETYCERNPLTDENISVDETIDNASFGGYDPMRGIYKLYVANPVGGFYGAYNVPNRNFRVNFSIDGLTENRDIYIMSYNSGGILECAALMDENMMMLPTPIEVIKNFSEAGGERNLYNIDDPSFSEAILTLPLEANTSYEYNLLNLYQNWGKYPLKQLSQIPFHCPYYHLSTGTTETNCIVPWFSTANVAKNGAGNTLPDFRSMSAPFWQGQPQHNSCGSHTWLSYTDANGVYSAVESKKNTITSFGPTYAEVVMDNLSDDGKIQVSYTHMEMPQLDENRTYYTMEYNVLEDLTISDFRNTFQFYRVTDNDATGSYKRIGYLNEQNQCVVVDSNQDDTLAPSYVLGDECPYFSFFYMPDWNRDSTSAEGYANVAFLVYDSEFIIGGEKVEPNFIIVNSKNYVRISLDLGDVTLKAGDKMVINAIVMPWGSQLYEDGIIDEAKGNFEYDMIINEETGELYQDKNVRDVRENTLLNPLTVTSETDEIIASPFLPKVRSKDGKTAEFTLSGGENNVTVRIYGFDMLTAPKVEEYVNGEWIEYVLSSKDTPDRKGYYHYYDGYGVQYDGDGTYSYSFVTTMNDGAPRKFRIAADTEFTEWPEEIPPVPNVDLLKVYADPDEIKSEAEIRPNMYGTPVLSEDGKYVSIYVNPENTGEAYSTYYTCSTPPAETGQYFVIMYRVPETNSANLGYMQLWSKTVNSSLGTGDSISITPKADGEWHVEIYDLANSDLQNFDVAEDGKYYARTMRFDVFNKGYTDGDIHIDIAFMGIDSDLSAICELVEEDVDFITFYKGGDIGAVNTKTGEIHGSIYIDPASGYTRTELPYGATIDSFNSIASPVNSYSKTNAPRVHSGVTVSSNLTITLRGWSVVEGGIKNYVWSVDGGKTWNVISGSSNLGKANDAMLNNVVSANKVAFSDTEATKVNGSFQSSGLVIDLSAYAGQTVDVILAAVPAAEENTLALLYCFKEVNCASN